MRREIDGGVNVAVEKQRQKQEALLAITVNMLAAEYFQKAEKGMALKTGHEAPHLSNSGNRSTSATSSR